MKILNINTKSPYNVIIRDNILKDIGYIVKEIKDYKKICIISDSNVAPIYSKCVISSLESFGIKTCLFVFKAGEESKNLNTINDMYSFFCKNDLTRSDLLIALGGGVTGDMTGFAAATYLRGIDYIQIPTSLLAQIDSSIGGKTGVDIDYGKNLVGAFHQPQLVVIDSDVLSTLDDYYFFDGLAEAVKYGCIKSERLFRHLQYCQPKYFVDNLIYDCLNIKRSLVEKDEFETSKRILLNFGHTIGHAIEKIYNYKKFSHGRAVAIGMSMITKVSERHGLTDKGTYKKLTDLLKKHNLPVSDNCSLLDIVKYSSSDKKNIGSNLNLVLIKNIGNSFVHSIDKNSFLKFLESGE